MFKLFISFLPVIPLYFIAKEILWNDVKIFGFLSYYYLVFTLSITPISKIVLKYKKIKKYSNTIITYRRPLGILAWLFSILHLINFEENIRWLWIKFYSEKISYTDFLLDSIFWWWWESIIWMNFYAFWLWFTWFIIMLSLLFTSNNYSQKIMWVKFWKYLQRLVYPLFIIVVLHIYFIWWWKWLYLYPWITIVFLRLYVWFYTNYEKKLNNQYSNSKYKKFLCLPCWFIYDEELWDEDGWLIPWTKFEDIPDNRRCPVCFVTKKDFIPLDWHYNPEISEDHELDFLLEYKKYLTEDVIEIRFLCKKKLEVKAWQFCNFIFNVWNEKIRRSYSIAKYIDNTLYFLIKLSKDGDWSKEIKKLVIWNKVKVLWPYWDFILNNSSNKKIFIATWTGLSPIYSMLLEAWNIPKELHFWVRDKKDLFYINKLKNIPKLDIYIYLSKWKNKKYIHWRIDINKFKINKNDEIYICWNPSLVEESVKMLKNKEIENVYFEKFL